MSIAKSIARSIARPIARALAGFAEGGAAAWDPDNVAGVLQVLRPYAYAGSTVGGLPVLESSIGTLAQPRGQRCYLADGADDYIAIASLVGTETVTSKEGTSTPTISAGRIDLTAGTLWNMVLSNGSVYYCNEEAGTTAYDSSGNARHGTLTNVTVGTFHSTHANVAINYANERGHTLTGSTVIPRNEADTTKDVLGAVLEYAGPIQLPVAVEVLCVAGNGTDAYIDCGSALLPASADFTFSMYYRPLAGQHVFAGQDSMWLFQNNTHCWMRIDGAYNIQVSDAFAYGQWHLIEGVRSGSTHTVTITNVETGTVTAGNYSASFSYSISANTHILEGAGLYTNGMAAMLSVLTAGVTKTFPLQDGPGSSNTNRDVAWVGSDGTGGVISGAIVNGTVATIWANRTAYAEDHCINYGGGIAANGAYVAGRIGASNDAAGNAKTIAIATHGNPWTKLVPNNWSAPSLVNIGSTSSDKYGPTDMAGIQAESTADTRFASDTAYLSFAAALTGSDKSNAEAYV